MQSLLHLRELNKKMQTNNITMLLILLKNTVFMIVMMPEIGEFNFDLCQILS